MSEESIKIKEKPEPSKHAKHYFSGPSSTGILMATYSGAEYVATENGNFCRANKTNLRTKKERNRDKKLYRKYNDAK